MVDWATAAWAGAWWLLLGALIGWSTSWLVAARDLRRAIRSPEQNDRLASGFESDAGKVVDNPAHLARIAELEEELGVMDDLRQQIRALRAAPAFAQNGLIPPAGVPAPSVDSQPLKERIEMLNLEVVEWRERYVALEQHASEQQQRIASLESERAAADSGETKAAADRSVDGGESAEEDRTRVVEVTEVDQAAAQTAGFEVRGYEDLELIEGIGPHIAEALRSRGIASVSQLACMSAVEMQQALLAAGPNLRLVNPGSWPAQALLATSNHWSALRALQQVLAAQKRRQVVSDDES